MRCGMVIDTSRCVACHACEIACKSANNVPEGVFWNRVLTDGGPGIETLAGEYPNGTISVMTVSCQHCENPACVKVCPVGATYKIPKRESFVRIMKSALAVVCACPHVRILVYARSIGMNQSICSTLRLAMLRFLPIRGILLRNAPSAIREFRRVKRQLVWCFVLAELAFGAISMIPIPKYRD